MAEETISQRVDRLLSGVTDDQRPFLHSYLSGLVDRLSKAEQSVVSGLALFGAMWAAAYLVSKGFIGEVAPVGVHLIHVQDLLIAVPPILGFVSYNLSAALSVSMVLEEAVREIYIKCLPTLGKTGLESLFWSHTFIGAEQHEVLATRSRLETVLSAAVEYGIVVFCWFGAGAAIIHVGYLAEQLHRWPQWLTYVSVVLGCLLWLRGAVMIYHRTVS